MPKAVKEPNKSIPRKKITKSHRAGIVMPVGRIHKILKTGKFARRVSLSASIYISATLQYLVAEILELASNAAVNNNRGSILPRHLLLAVRNDQELHRMLANVTFSQSGVIPLPKVTKVQNYNDMSSQEY